MYSPGYNVIINLPDTINILYDVPKHLYYLQHNTFLDWRVWYDLLPYLEVRYSPVVDTAGIMKTPMHDDVIKWKHFPRNWPFVRGIHRSR